MDVYKLNKEEVFKKFNSSIKGLSEKQVNELINQYGYNELKEKKENKALKVFINQVNSFVVYILVAAVVISLVTKNYLDSIVVSAILILNTILGFFQEYRA